MARDFIADIDSILNSRLAGTATTAFVDDLKSINDIFRANRAGMAAAFEADRIAAGGVPARADATLPECATFVGAGTRCAACRILRKIHA